jgi:hypothetical protein
MNADVTEITAPEFIEHRLLPGIKSMIDQGFAYLAFPLVAQTIELIGAFFDPNPFDQSGVDASRRADRFQNGIKHLFKDSVYKNNQKVLYENLRCSFAHQMRPGSGFLLTSTRNGFTEDDHLDKTDNGERLVVIEYFFADLERAVKRLLNDIKREQNIDKSKVSEVFLVVRRIATFTGGTNSLGTVSAAPV